MLTLCVLLNTCAWTAEQVQELRPRTLIEVGSVANEFAFNGVNYNSDTQLGMIRGTYTFRVAPNSNFAFSNIVPTDSLLVKSSAGIVTVDVQPTFASANANLNGATLKVRRMHPPGATRTPKLERAGSTSIGAAVAASLLAAVAVLSTQTDLVSPRLVV